MSNTHYQTCRSLSQFFFPQYCMIHCPTTPATLTFMSFILSPFFTLLRSRSCFCNCCAVIWGLDLTHLETIRAQCDLASDSLLLDSVDLFFCLIFWIFWVCDFVGIRMQWLISDDTSVSSKFDIEMCFLCWMFYVCVVYFICLF